LFGVTFVVVATEHPLVSGLLAANSKVLNPTDKETLQATVKDITNTRSKDKQDANRPKKGK